MHLFNRSSIYSLKKSKSIFKHTISLFKKKQKRLSEQTQKTFLNTLTQLQEEISLKNRESASTLAKQAENLCQQHLKKSSLEHFKDLVSALGFALVIAVLVRQMWFEFYEIPTGSMRPTLKEQDRLVVSKTDFGINVPLKPKQFLFDPELVKRSGIIVFTGENMDIHDVDTLYFYIFPGKKQYIKRLMGKPGDLLYFYGGQLYGIDSEGNDITATLQYPSLNAIEHIPFIDFERKLSLPATPSYGYYSPVILYQMNEPVAKLSVTSQGNVQGEMLNPSNIHASGSPALQSYSEMWGFKNFGMARLLTREQVRILTDSDPAAMENGVLYLEIRHHPSLQSGKIIQDEWGRRRPTLGISTSIIPLQEHHVKEIFENMYTARFQVKKELGYRYGAPTNPSSFTPSFPGVPDGCYEYYYGKAYKVGWQGITYLLPSEHPLYRYTPEMTQLLYDVGIELDMRFFPQGKYQRLTPARYTYYRNGDLYLLGAPILKKDDPALLAFQQREDTRAKMTSTQNPYFPFVDAGPPLKTDGSLDKALIRKYGLKIPQQMYLALGDNHAMSADSREFGFVPQDNLRGGPDFIFWPPGSRWGTPNQPSYPFFNTPRTLIWAIVALVAILSTIYWRKRHRLP